MIGYKLIKTEQQMREACEILSRVEAVGLDSETTSLHPRNGNLRLLQLSSGQDTYIIDFQNFDRAALVPLKTFLESDHPKKIAHNAAFDRMWIWAKLGIDVVIHMDTMLADIMIAVATVGINNLKHGLKQVVKRYLREEMDKESQDSDWSGPLTEIQLQYAARDAQVLVPLRTAIKQRIAQYGLQRVALMEFEAIPAVADLALNGFPVDHEMYSKLCVDIEKARDIQAAKFQTLIRSTRPERGIQTSLFADLPDLDYSEANLDSWQQVTQAFRSLGVPIFNQKKDENLIKEYIKKGLPFARSTNEKEIAPLVPYYPVLQQLLDYRDTQKQFTVYGPPMLERIHNGRIYANIFQIGTETGRTIFRNPNLQQVPQDEKFRQCYRPVSGRKFSINDYGQIELRILADISRDPILVQIYKDDLDLHAMTQSKIFGMSYEDAVENKDKYKAERTFAKTLNFGIAYGMGAPSYSQRTGRPLEDAVREVAAFKEGYPVMDRYLYNAANKGLQTLSATTKAGRLVKFYPPPPEGDTPESREAHQKAKGAIKRNAKNHPIQGGSADILKTALKNVRNSIKGYDAMLVHSIHDEIIVETGEHCAEEVNHLVKEAMIKSAEEFIHMVPVKVDGKVCDSWAEK